MANVYFFCSLVECTLKFFWRVNESDAQLDQWFFFDFFVRFDVRWLFFEVFICVTLNDLRLTPFCLSYTYKYILKNIIEPQTKPLSFSVCRRHKDCFQTFYSYFCIGYRSCSYSDILHKWHSLTEKYSIFFFTFEFWIPSWFFIFIFIFIWWAIEHIWSVIHIINNIIEPQTKRVVDTKIASKHFIHIFV